DVGTELARRTRCAVLGRLEVTDEVVVLERREDEYRGENRQAREDQPAAPHRRSDSNHRVDDTPFQRPTTSLSRPATPPRSGSPACGEPPAVPMMPGTWVY